MVVGSVSSHKPLEAAESDTAALRRLAHCYGNFRHPVTKNDCRGLQCAVVSALCSSLRSSRRVAPKSQKTFPLAALRFDYQTWNCCQLAEESDLLRDALAVASEQRAIDTVAHLKTAMEEVHKASTLKKCKA
jgi:hypothetical protein